MDVSAMNDEMLITQCISEGYGNEALKELFRRYGQLLLQTITWTFKKYSQVIHEDVEDIFQEVFALLFKNQCIALKRFNPIRASLGTYLSAIARNCVISNLKSRKYKEIAYEDVFENGDLSVEAMLEKKEYLEKIIEVLKSCTAKEQLFFKLYYKENIPCEEIAQVLTVSVDTIYSKKAKIIAKLKTALSVFTEQ